MKTLLMMAGGTGGHIFPALAVAEKLRDAKINVVWLGSRTGLESRIVPAAGFQSDWLDIRGVRNSGWLRVLQLPFVLTRAMWQAHQIIRRRTPMALLGMGGFASGPGGLMAVLMRLPLLIHESNARPGLTNRLLAPLARYVMCGFPNTAGLGKGADWTGNPLRADLLDIPPPSTRYRDREGALRLLVVGARALNQVVPEAIALLSEDKRPIVVHQCGSNELSVVRKTYHRLGVAAQVTGFIDDMRSAYSVADLVIARSGAMTVSELCAVGVAALLIPYPYAAGDHQSANAAYLVEHQAALAVSQAALSPLTLSEMLGKFDQNRDQLHAMASQARALFQPNATDRVARQCLEALGA
jgi:UDP-N-acetylglucosamine--N-acetylmuramyl-(pentapeptide) pyrophosphoryl-undecaprenol N-acetylglucosamine transferase